jgi:sRNA-binding regulator protein Hfq
MSNSEKLLVLAKAQFGVLTIAEEKLFNAVAKGEAANFQVGKEEIDHPTQAESWTDERTLKADRIAWLCTDKEVSSFINHKGLEIKGLRIEGKLDLEFAIIPFPLHFWKCCFSKPIILSCSKLLLLNLDGCHIKPLNADSMQVSCSVFLRNGFKAEGEVRLLRASIGGNLECDNSQFDNPTGMSLSADGIQVSGGVFLRNGFKAQGEVRFHAASIGVDLDCSNGQFCNPNGKALNVDGVQVSRYILLRNGFKAQGEVSLLRASIAGSLDCDASQFYNPEGIALNGEGMQVSNGVFLRNEFKAEGRVDFTSAVIKSYFMLTSAETKEIALILNSCHIGTLRDDKCSWPTEGKLFLTGFTYDKLAREAPQDAKSRLRWLRLQPNDLYSPQPYEQLAKVLRESGHERDAKEILIAKERDRGRWEKLSPAAKFQHWVLGRVIAYGYKPFRALWYIGLVIVLGTLLFGLGNPELLSQTDPSKSAPPFNAFMYSVDAFLPVIDFHQESFWLPDAVKSVPLNTLDMDIWGWPLKFPQTWTVNVSGSWLRYYFWFHIAAGWFFTSLFVAGLTGLVKR